ncbi:MAG: DUF4158 domain-containing protein, partial [Chloroflexi bacterium]|nr:DUF4158 domain-containing protein [Chloroflexota bacterium]
MPSRFLSKAERARLSRFPAEVSDNDCIIYFTLTPADLNHVKQKRKEENQLGFALLLCSLRYLGHFPPKIHQVPTNIVRFVAQQLQVSSNALADYAERDETRREHVPEAMQHLGFRRSNANDKKELIAWLGARALEHDRPTLLLQQACERLYQLRLVRPAITTMEDLVSAARGWAEKKTVEVLVHSLPKRVQNTVDTLLVNDEDRGMSAVTWLRRYTTGHSDKDILVTLEKLVFIHQWNVASWQVDELPPMRIQHLAQVARYTSTRSLKRKNSEGKRHAILVAFLIWAHEKTIDELFELFDLCLAKAFRKSKRELKEFQLQHMARMQKVLGYFREMSQVVTNDKVPDEAVRANIYEQVPEETLQTTL